MDKVWKPEFKHVKAVFPDAEVFEVTAAYEAFHAKVDGVRMIFYPHTVQSTRNKHLRVRNGTPQRKEDFLALAHILGLSKSPDCTFHVKNQHGVGWDRTTRTVPDKYQHYLDRAKSLREAA